MTLKNEGPKNNPPSKKPVTSGKSNLLATLAPKSPKDNRSDNFKNIFNTNHSPLRLKF